ncbi:MAG: hypothetical protein LAT64_04920 [Phycisphaerales bacterium]|nr:hypothetical protein [Planctomycetota bacterium]MCH8508097.1 hypothetical protein [Phycisphaerales bacterium]
MSIGHGQTTRPHGLPVCVPAPERRGDAPPLRSLAVVWRVNARSLGAHAPNPAGRITELAVRIDAIGPSARGSVTVRDPDSADAPRTIETFERVGVEVIPDMRSEIHIECPGVLHATIAPEGDAWRLVYARTPLLDALGIPGGRAEAVGVIVG